MTQRHFVVRSLGVLALAFQAVGVLTQGATSSQTPLAETRQKADQGDADAQFKLGASYSTGSGVPQDVTQAVIWYRKAADQGHAGAQYNLGFRYATGQGVPQDFPQAAAWFRKAADQGDADAQFNLGAMYNRGRGVAQDSTQAVAWFRKAADQGDADAQFNLGVMHSKGEGVPQDYVEAHKWCSLAASHAVGGSQKRYAEARDATAKNLTPAQLADAQKRVADWQAVFEKRQLK